MRGKAPVVCSTPRGREGREGITSARSRYVAWQVVASTAFALVALVLLCLVGCGPPPSIPTPTPTKTARPFVTLPPTPDISAIQTQAAEDVLATLTAEAPTANLYANGDSNRHTNTDSNTD